MKEKVENLDCWDGHVNVREDCAPSQLRFVQLESDRRMNFIFQITKFLIKSLLLKDSD